MSKKQKSIDADAVIKFFGGKHQIVNDYEKILKTVITVKAVEKWLERKSVPMSAILNLTSIAEKRQLDFTVEKFIV